MKCRKLLAILLALVMVIGLLPFAALAEEVPGSSPGDEVSDNLVADQNDPLPEGDPLGTDPEDEPQDEPLPEGDPLGEQSPEVSLLDDEHAESTALNQTDRELSGGSYYLSGNVELNQPVTFTGTATLCLNGHTLSCDSDYVIEVTSGTLTICDCKETGAVTTTNTKANAVIRVGEGNTLNIEAGTISGGQRGVSAEEGATVNVSGGSIACATSSKQGALRLYSANAYITGGTITGNVWMMTTSTVRLSGTPSIDKIRLSLTEGKAGRLYAAIGSTPYAGNQIPVECTSTTVQPETPIIYDVTDANKNLFKLTAPEGMEVKFENGNLVFGDPASNPGHSHEDDDPSVTWTELTAQDRQLKSGHYYLGNNITVNETTDHISITGDVTLCLNSHALTSSVAQTSFIYVEDGGSLTLCDCGNGGKVESLCGSSRRVIFVRKGGSCTIESGMISGIGIDDKLNGKTIKVEPGGSLTLNGGKVTGSTGIYNQGTTTVSGGTVECDKYGIHVGGNLGVVNMKSGSVSATGSDGVSGIYMNYGSLEMTGGTVSGTTYGIELQTAVDNKSFVISGGTITGGYGIYFNSEKCKSPLYLTGKPTLSTLHLSKPTTLIFASKGGSPYSGGKVTVSLESGEKESAVIISGISNNANKFTYAGEDFELKEDGKGNLILQTPTTAPEHANHGVDGTDTDPQTWQPWTQATDLSSITSGYYYLTANITHDGMVIIESGADVHICLNGQTMTQSVLYVGNNASVTICDCKDNGEIIGGSTGALMLNGGSTVNFYSGTISSEATDAVNITLVTAEAQATFNMYGGTINSKKMGISNNGGIVNVYGGTILFDDYAGVFNGNDRSVATIAGGTIQPQEDAARGDNGVYVSKGTLYLTGDAEISGLKGDIKINNPNAVYASNGDAAYSGDLLNIYFSGAAAETDPIILNVTSENAALFELVRPYGKDLVRKGNNLYLADKLPPMPKLTVTVDTNPLTYGQEAQATVSGAPDGVDVTYTYSIVNGDGIATINAQTGEITATGIGTFQVKVVASADGYEDGEAISAEVTVSKATPTPEAPTGLTATYGDTLANIALPTGWTWKTPETSVGNVGTHKFEAVYQETPEEYYIPVTKMLSVVVNAKTITDAVVVLGAYPTYDGTQKTQTITSVTVDGTVLTAGSDYTVTGNTGTEAKEYTLTITGTGNYSGTKEVTWYIQKAIPGVTAPTIRTLTYTGTAQALLNPGNTEQGTMVYSLQETEGYSVDIPKKTDAGTYDVWYKVLGYDGYQNTNPVKLQVTIKKAPLTVTADDIWVYAGNTPKFTATIKGYVNGEDWRVLKGELTFTCGYSQKYSKPGSRYTITPKGLTADNYDITFKTGTLTVKDPLSPRFNVYVLDSKHGTVEADCRYARKGDVVTLTIKPDWGYELETLTVTDSHGYELKLTYHSNGTYTFTMPRDNVTVKAIFTVRDMPFVDVPGDAWYAGGVRYVYAHGLMNGTGNWRFSPNRTTTRAMIATILYRMEGSPRVYGTSQFGDVVSGSWYEDAVIWATQNDIVEGYTSKTFGPNDPITREQMAAMLYRYADYCRCDMSAGRYVDLSKYSDMNEISDYAIPALRWAVGEEIIEGRTGKRLAPTDTATRAEVAVMLMRFCEDVIW